MNPRALLLLPLLAASVLAGCTGGIGTGPGSGPGLLPADPDFDHLTRVGHWINSREEQGFDGVEIYRPSGFTQFPSSWFRMEYIFRADNTCDWLYLAPNDAHYLKPGTWVRDLQEKDVIRINQDGQIISYRILELTTDILRMQSIP